MYLIRRELNAWVGDVEVVNKAAKEIWCNGKK